MRFTDNYPHIKTFSIGPPHFDKSFRRTHRLRIPASFDGLKLYRSNTLRQYKASM